MLFRVNITKEAEQDVYDAIDYLEAVLFNRRAADELAALAENTIMSLAVYPRRYQLCNDIVLQAYGVRYVPVKKYLLLYTIDEELRQVNVLSFVYGRRQWQSLILAKLEDESYQIKEGGRYVNEDKEAYGGYL